MRAAAQGQVVSTGSMMSQMEAAKAKAQQLRKELDLLEQHVAIVGGALQPFEGSASGPIGRPPQGKLNLFSQMQAGSSGSSQMASSQMASSGVSSTGGGGGDGQHFKKEKSKSDVSTFQDGGLSGRPCANGHSLETFAATCHPRGWTHREQKQTWRPTSPTARERPRRRKADRSSHRCLADWLFRLSAQPLHS
jgi:hypothetical protein